MCSADGESIFLTLENFQYDSESLNTGGVLISDILNTYIDREFFEPYFQSKMRCLFNDHFHLYGNTCISDYCEHFLCKANSESRNILAIFKYRCHFQ